MRWIICPRCELNYIQEGEKLCSVCRKEVRGEQEVDDMIEMCSECGEHPAVPGGELCVYCLKELARQDETESDEGTIVTSEAAVGGIDSVSSMEEIELDIPDAEFDSQDVSFEEDEDDEDKDEDEDEN